MLSVLHLGHFIGQRTDFGRSIVAGIAGLSVSNDGWERKSTISQEVVVVTAVCWPVDDVDSSVVYGSVVLGFGRLFHGGAQSLLESVSTLPPSPPADASARPVATPRSRITAAPQ